MVALAALVCGTAALSRDGSWPTAVIAGCEVALLVARYFVILAFKRANAEADPSSDMDAWLMRFSVLAIGSSLSWGALCFLCLAFSHDPVLYVIPVLSTVGTAGAVAARNSGVPRLAKAQLAASLLPILCGCVLADDPGYRWLLVLVPAMATGLVILIDERNKQLVDLIESQAELARLSVTDPLTQVSNRRYLDRTLEVAAVTGRTSALLMIDVDHFKVFNDKHGHLAGDRLLRQIAAVLRDHVRHDHDVVARYGGEEFAVLLDGSALAEGVEAGERLKRAVTSLCQGPAGHVVTISVGVIAWDSAMDHESILRGADSALYMAKRAGRNRVETAAPLICSSSQRLVAEAR